MLPHRFSNRSAGNHSGSRAISEYSESHVTEETIFFSDSRAAIQAVCGSRVRSSTVHQCIEALQTLSTHTNVKIKWTRAHVGTAGNERADQLAKLATENPFIGPEPQFPFHTLSVRSFGTGLGTRYTQVGWDVHLPADKRTKPSG